MANKLELTWYGKDKPIKVEPRLLIENAALSNTAGDLDTENMLIHGDNLLALKALESKYAGQVKCIYIDPPYNTGSAFEHYDDNLEHSIWLNLMYERIKILNRLLSEDGCLWISIDNTEGHYLKVLCDEIFTRKNFVADITYEKSNVSGLGQGGVIVNTGEKLLVYKKGNLVFNEVLGVERLAFKTMKRYNKMLLDKGEKVLIEEFPAPSNGKPVKVYKHSNCKVESISLRDFTNRENEIRQQFYEHFKQMFRTYVIQQENEFQNLLMDKMEKGTLYSVEYTPNRGKNKDKYTTLYYYNAELCAWLSDTAFIKDKEIVKTTRLSNVWKNDDIPKADLGNEGSVTFPRSKKPERLIERILLLSTNHGDLVLDSFLGSGTTAAVAHKMGRRYIGIEMGGHAYTHCKARLDKVISGKDKGGISKSVNWLGGGGYRFYELAPTLINKDDFGEYVINREYDADLLAAAVALHEGFKYQPNDGLFWKQSVGNEDSFLFVTTRHLNRAYIDSIKNTMEENEYLIIACRSFDSGLDKAYGNITIKKIPQMLLEHCEFGKTDYKLNIVHPPVYEEDEEDCDE
ncbi:site-specific DNA-methyltransferase [Lachnospiraceae bacterium NSJ-143]|nr:site-specific DNA-methyltransferase [Lachnospiraceae bacterium NSJ-143]